MANFPENWCFGILPEPRNFPENWCFGTSTQPRPLAESSQHVHRLATCTLQLLKTSLRWIAIDKKSKWIIWGYPDFRTQGIWFFGHSRLNPNFIIDNHYFAALNILSVVLSSVIAPLVALSAVASITRRGFGQIPINWIILDLFGNMITFDIFIVHEISLYLYKYECIVFIHCASCTASRHRSRLRR